MKITLCGSARFETEFVRLNRELTLLGHIVYSLAAMPSQSGGKDWYDPEQKVILDLAHLAKIEESDAVVVVGDGYVGESTAREILWADMRGKAIVQGLLPDTATSIIRELRTLLEVPHLARPGLLEAASKVLKGEPS